MKNKLAEEAAKVCLSACINIDNFFTENFIENDDLPGFIEDGDLFGSDDIDLGTLKAVADVIYALYEKYDRLSKTMVMEE